MALRGTIIGARNGLKPDLLTPQGQMQGKWFLILTVFTISLALGKYFLRLTAGYAQGILLILCQGITLGRLRELYVVQGIEARSAAHKAGTLPAVLSLQSNKLKKILIDILMLSLFPPHAHTHFLLLLLSCSRVPQLCAVPTNIFCILLCEICEHPRSYVNVQKVNTCPTQV